MEKDKQKPGANEERYSYFINSLLQNKEVWLLKAQDGMYAMFEDNTEQQYIPAWPDKKYADEFIQGDWENYSSDKMELKEFKTWLYELKEDKIRIAAFPELSMKTTPVKPEELIEHLMVRD